MGRDVDAGANVRVGWGKCVGKGFSVTSDSGSFVQAQPAKPLAHGKRTSSSTMYLVIYHPVCIGHEPASMR